MKYLITLAALLLLLTSCNKEKNNAINAVTPPDTIVANAPGLVIDSLHTGLAAPFSTLDFDRVVACDYDGGPDGAALIIGSDGTPNASVKKAVTLNPQQVKSITGILGDPKTYGEPLADCFNPHMGLVFYKKDVVVLHISICIECSQLKSSMAIPAMVRPHTDPKTGKELFGEGFSDAGQQKLEALCASFKFSHCSGQPE